MQCFYIGGNLIRRQQRLSEIPRLTSGLSAEVWIDRYVPLFRDDPSCLALEWIKGRPDVGRGYWTCYYWHRTAENCAVRLVWLEPTQYVYDTTVTIPGISRGMKKNRCSG